MTREELIQNIKDCGQSIIDNAENIFGDYTYGSGLTITCCPFNNNCEAPRIVVERIFIPENIVERYK